MGAQPLELDNPLDGSILDTLSEDQNPFQSHGYEPTWGHPRQFAALVLHGLMVLHVSTALSYLVLPMVRFTLIYTLEKVRVLLKRLRLIALPTRLPGMLK